MLIDSGSPDLAALQLLTQWYCYLIPFMAPRWSERYSLRSEVQTRILEKFRFRFAGFDLGSLQMLVN